MIKSNFDKLAPWYSFLEKYSFGNKLQVCRIMHLLELTNAKDILILGDGNGRFLEAFLNINPNANIISFDFSTKMLELAKRRISFNPDNNFKIKFLLADALIFDFPFNCYDLIVTNFFLDCFTEKELDQLFPRVSASLKNNGQWLIGDFNYPGSNLKNIISCVGLSAMYLFFKIFTGISALKLVESSPYFIKSGYKLKEEKFILGSFLTSKLWIKSN